MENSVLVKLKYIFNNMNGNVKPDIWLTLIHFTSQIKVFPDYVLLMSYI